jgi:hypothetical protein
MTKATHDNLEAILHDPSSIKTFDEPSEDMVDLAVSLNPDLIKEIKNSTSSERLEALRRDPNSIRHFIETATSEERMMALELDPLTIQHFPNPTEGEQVFAVDKDEKSFDFIDDKVLEKKTSEVYLIKYHKIGFLPI